MSSPHALLSLIFIASRAALYLAGIRFDFSLDWMWLSDPADLRERLLETLYYFHSFPPGMNLVTGLLLKVGGADAATLALATFWGVGLVFVNALFYLCRVSGLPTPVALGIALAFSLLPQSIYFEHLYLYEYPTAALLCMAAVFFYEAVRRQSFWMWLAFFAICTAVGVTRSTFHLVWFAAMVGAGLWLSERQSRRRVLNAAAVPASLLLGLYVKNFALFGAFSVKCTFGFVSHNLVTTWHLSPDVRDSWIAEGRLSPLAAVSVYAGPREYLSFLGSSVRTDGPPQLTRLDRPSVRAGNYNHRLFLEVNRRRNADARAYVRARPLEYAATVLTGLRDMFTPSTVWHPAEPTGRSPHHQHRQVLGSYEAFSNRLMHSLPVPPVGLYAFVPLVAVWTLRRAGSLLRSGDSQGRALGALLSFCLLQIAFVVTVSSAFTFRESARYRYLVEAMLWLLTAHCVAGLWQSWRRRPPRDCQRNDDAAHFRADSGRGRFEAHRFEGAAGLAADLGAVEQVPDRPARPLLPAGSDGDAVGDHRQHQQSTAAPDRHTTTELFGSVLQHEDSGRGCGLPGISLLSSTANSADRGSVAPDGLERGHPQTGVPHPHASVYLADQPRGDQPCENSLRGLHRHVQPHLKRIDAECHARVLQDRADDSLHDGGALS